MEEVHDPLLCLGERHKDSTWTLLQSLEMQSNLGTVRLTCCNFADACQAYPRLGTNSIRSKTFGLGF